MFHAQINESSVVIAISDLVNDESHQDHLILIDSYDFSLLGKTYNKNTKAFEETTKSAEQLLLELQNEYVEKISRFQLLGESEEVIKLQQEYKQKKKEINS